MATNHPIKIKGVDNLKKYLSELGFQPSDITDCINSVINIRSSKKLTLKLPEEISNIDDSLGVNINPDIMLHSNELSNNLIINHKIIQQVISINHTETLNNFSVSKDPILIFNNLKINNESRSILREKLNKIINNKFTTLASSYKIEEGEENDTVILNYLKSRLNKKNSSLEFIVIECFLYKITNTDLIINNLNEEIKNLINTPTQIECLDNLKNIKLENYNYMKEKYSRNTWLYITIEDGYLKIQLNASSQKLV